MLSLSSENDTAVLESLSAILVYVGFPERDVLEKNITILLSDIRGFSDIAESYPAADVVRMLNRYFDAMGNIITVVALLLIHMLVNAVAAINPARTRLARDPVRATIQ